MFNPSLSNPCIVQINYSDGDISFYKARDKEDALASYGGNIVAIFKPKSITRSVSEDTAQN